MNTTDDTEFKVLVLLSVLSLERIYIYLTNYGAILLKKFRFNNQYVSNVSHKNQVLSGWIITNLNFFLKRHILSTFSY